MRELSPKWTDVQRDCIRSRGETLLVSAAAGSGKTSVLTERIIDRVLDEENPLDLSRVLVVTFTKAAAAELRNRIRESLSRELAARPENRRLRNQVVALGSAKISTIDSFYYSFVRTHFSECRVSAGVRVADEAESRLLAKTVMDALLDDYFEGRIQEEKDRIESFGAFSNLFVTSRSSDSLAEILLGLYTRLSGFAEGIRWLSRQADAVGAMDPARFPCGDSSYEAFFRDVLSSLPGRFLSALSKCGETVRSSEAVEKNYGAAFDYAKEWLTGLSERLQRGAVYSELKDYLSYDQPKLGSGIRGEKKTAESEAVKRLLSEIRDRVRETADRYFRADPSHLPYLFASHASVARSLYRLLSLFDRRLRAEKERRGVLSFPDLARLTLELLEDPETGKITDIARETASRFDEIYIDEYQDVSPIQDRIFSALSSPRNRFMVGDAKQSIYAFRGATPELFLDYRALFAESPAEGRTIFLSSNFRSDSHIIRFCNDLFAPLFAETGDTPYSEEDALLYAKPESGTEQQSAVEFALFDRGGTAAARPEDSDLSEEEQDGDEDAESVPLSEAAWVARRIQQLLSGGTRRDGTPLRPGDIAVLVRSASASAEPIRRALSAYGIPSRDSVSRAFFENPEVLLIYSLLTVIDNPQKDVFLAGTLKSPLYRVTLDELIHIRTAHPEGSLFDALTAFTEETGFAKGRRFLERLEYYRHLSGGIPIDRFLWMLYEDTGILSLVYRRESDPLFSEGEEASPAQMRANLMMFYEYARSFSSGAFRGLYEFVEFIGSVIEDKAKLPVLQTAAVARTAGDPDTRDYVMDCLLDMFGGYYGTVPEEDTEKNNAELASGEGRIIA
ncbi:MAG: UvrD-helicase domain-containing protein, partial [Clostridia bacterium]|nr:UvrD-helicase domain-containing protein [Clostridia bacterium]